IVYLVLQGVGDGIQPLMSQFYGAGKKEDLSHANRFAYLFALLLSLDRKSTRLNSSHVSISYAVFCLKKKSNSEQAGSPNRPRVHISRSTMPHRAPLPLYACSDPHALHSFPTRRSSDLHCLSGAPGSR